jgi:hypothetical protein
MLQAQSMPESKQQLVELIEAYATAKATGNALLIQSAGATLVGYLESVEITEAQPASAELTETETEQTDA